VKDKQTIEHSLFSSDTFWS